MKKWSNVISLLLFFVVLCSCGVQNGDNITIANDTTEKMLAEESDVSENCEVMTEPERLEDYRENITYEMCDYFTVGVEKFLQITNEYDWVEKSRGYYMSSNKTMYIKSEADEMIYVMLDINSQDETNGWKIYNLSPDMNLDNFLEVLEDDIVVIESHNAACIAMGIALEKVGIEKLQWERHDPVGYIKATINRDLINDLAEYEVTVSEDTYTSYNEEKNIKIEVKYPIFALSNDMETTKIIAENISNTITELVQKKETVLSENSTVLINYTICNITSKALSISWYDVGNLPRDVESAMTCSIMDGGKILELDEYGRSFEQIVEQVGYRENWNETEDWKDTCRSYEFARNSSFARDSILFWEYKS